MASKQKNFKRKKKVVMMKTACSGEKSKKRKYFRNEIFSHSSSDLENFSDYVKLIRQKSSGMQIKNWSLQLMKSKLCTVKKLNKKDVFSWPNKQQTESADKKFVFTFSPVFLSSNFDTGEKQQNLNLNLEKTANMACLHLLQNKK